VRPAILAIERAAHDLTVDRDHAFDPRRQRPQIATETGLEGHGIEQAEDREKVSWLGMPPGRCRNRRNSGSLTPEERNACPRAGTAGPGGRRLSPPPHSIANCRTAPASSLSGCQALSGSARIAAASSRLRSALIA